MLAARQRAFSLVELLAVIAIIGIVAAFAIPATQSALRGSALDSASTLLSDQMSFARQHALSNSRTVEVRFYRFGDPEIPGERIEDPKSGHFRAFQLFERSDSGIWIPLGKVTRMPDLVVMNPGERLSTLLGEDYETRGVSESKVQGDSNNHPELPRNVKLNYEYMPFRFTPNGSTDLPPLGNAGKNSEGGLWHVTMHATTELPRMNPPVFDKAPPNYVTWMVDPISGIGKTYRPGLK